jgi:mitogen-activated protein kinase kinase
MQQSLDQFYGTLQKINSSEESKEIIDDINECEKPVFSIHEEYQIWLLPSQYICNTYGAYMNPNTGSVCLVFEHMMNGTLEDQIDFGVQPDERNIGAVAYVILNALCEMHDHNCIHRDIKPSNILIGNDGIVKVADSFIIRTFDDVSSCRTFSGTLLYMR